jgi:hypothetical protein
MLKRFFRRLAIQAGWYAIEQLIPKVEGTPGQWPFPTDPKTVTPDPDVPPAAIDLQVVEALAETTMEGMALWQITVALASQTADVQTSVLRLMARGLVVVDYKRKYHLKG